MVWEGLLGTPVSESDMDKMTGFREDEQSWPFEAMLAAANSGIKVRNIEDFNPKAFINDASAELLQISNNDQNIVDHTYRVSNVQRQKDIVEKCIVHPNIVFEKRIPSIKDLVKYIKSANTGVICNVNARQLMGKDGYNGHFVVVESFKGAGAQLRLQDPGSPPREDCIVDNTVFHKAWASPYPRMANMLVFEV
jgi:hypothetical protein